MVKLEPTITILHAGEVRECYTFQIIVVGSGDIDIVFVKDNTRNA